MTATMTMVSVEKFQSAEQLWFWFLYSKSIRNDFCRIRNTPTKRPCEILDVETMITKLYLSGKLTDEQLAVMKKLCNCAVEKRNGYNRYNCTKIGMG